MINMLSCQSDIYTTKSYKNKAKIYNYIHVYTEKNDNTYIQQQPVWKSRRAKWSFIN